MASPHEQRQAIWKRTDRRVVADQRQIAERIGLMFLREATALNAEGERAIPPSRTKLASLSKEIWKLVLKPYFIGSGDDPLDGIIPQSSYAEIIVDGVREAITFEAEQQVKLTRKLLKTKAPDLLDFLVEGIEIPGEDVTETFFHLVLAPTFDSDSFRDVDGKIIPEAAKKAFVRPKGTYDPFHKFVDPAGYRLSDRIWRSGLGERTAIDRFLDFHVKEGTSAVEMAKTLEVYLTGSAAGVGTAKPYGTVGSYSARRLARTEITAAAGRSTIAMSEANPFVGGIKWILSASHPDVDNCDKNARGGENGDGIYKPSEVPPYPDHPHELCTLSPQGADNIDDVVADLRAKLNKHKKAVFDEATEGTGTGLDIQKFKKMLDPKTMAEAAMTGTLDQTIATVAGKIHKATVGQKAKIAAALAKDAAKKKAAALKKAALEADAKIVAAEKAAEEAKAKEKAAQEKFAKEKAVKEAAIKAEAAKIMAELEETAKIAAEKAAKKALADAAKVAEAAKKAAGIPKVLEKIVKWEDKILDLETNIDIAKDTGDKKKLASLRASRSRFRKLIKEAKEELPEDTVIPVAKAPDEKPFGSLLDDLLPDVDPDDFLEDGFPSDVSRMTFVKDLGGSTGAKLVKDPVDGKLYVQKQGGDAGHIAEELATDNAYRTMGVNVPDAHLYKTGTRPTKLARFIEGDSLQKLRRNDKRAYMKAKIALQEDFAADALLGNWDVIGMDFDNIIVEKSGKVWRIDNGGGLRRRAQGGMKTELEFNWESKDDSGIWQSRKENLVWNEYVDDLWSMRNPNINSQTFEVFGDMDYFDLEKQIKKIVKNKTEITGTMPSGMMSLMGDRIKILEDIAAVSKTLRTDDWNSSYVDDFTKHSIGMRKREMISALPKELKRDPGRSSVTVVDPNTNDSFDNMRTQGFRQRAGERSHIYAVEEYMRNNGAEWDYVDFWANQQKGDSWLNGPQGVKHFFASQRGQMPEDKFWWKQGADYAKGLFDNNLQQLGADKYTQTFTQFHAFNYEFMRNVKIPKTNRTKQTVRLFRTESVDVMDRQNFKLHESGTMKRGAVESCSLLEEVYVHGTELTVQEVPFHRILGNYFFERKPGGKEGMFLGDGENEFVAMLDGLKVDYKKTRRYSY